jgi:hypothetical protein
MGGAASVILGFPAGGHHYHGFIEAEDAARIVKLWSMPC